jgi:hypothetical protein
MYDVHLHSLSGNGPYVCAEDGGGRELNVNRNQALGWETFLMWDLTPGPLMSGDMINLRAAIGQYVSAENGGGSTVVANRSNAEAWETFRLMKVGGAGAGSAITSGSLVAIQTADGIHYFCAENGGGGPLVANRTAIAGWETFALELIEEPKFVADTGLEDLGAGHFMHTRAALTIATGQLNAWTRTKTVTWFGGFRGGVAVLLADGDDNVMAVGQTPFQTYGVDGTAIGRSDRTDSWSAQIDPADAQRVERMLVFHTWNPASFGQIFDEWVARADRVASLGGKVVGIAKATQGAPSK